ncbi:type 1 glutamine amidotransferase [Paraconexibacter antarcticus]|uniref:Type 1 glutamine amidotransferase n=1 Tax=Paraconexibacter antarcticus TaxID=2949664 RepID=A0ABY5DVS0_9ACTN|nr:type 1 glutamine amidotransferase [Paraconexibacter antarcticus]UTI64952.1 type 1 glutamine amidotransferase [Paraconexibacter antarcticus]
MADLLVLQHQDDAPAGLLGGVLATRGAGAGGFTVRTIRVDREALPDPRGAAGIVVLGADASAVGAGSEPWIAPEVSWVRQAAIAGVPVLGICFGAQVLAAALGGRVHRMPAPQVGWIRTPSIDIRVLPSGPWLAWHEDAVLPPPNARVLARDEVCVQAFAAGPHLAVQFHPEVTPAIVEGWITADGRELADRVYDPDTLRAETAAHAGESAPAALRLFARWLSGLAPDG